jgi:CspA family cold shock protein
MLSAKPIFGTDVGNVRSILPVASDQARVRGCVKWYNELKGWGFITLRDHSRDIFVLAIDVQESGLDTLREGQDVTFTIERDDHRHREVARHIQIVGQCT